MCEICILQVSFDGVIEVDWLHCEKAILHEKSAVFSWDSYVGVTLFEDAMTQKKLFKIIPISRGLFNT